MMAEESEASAPTQQAPSPPPRNKQEAPPKPPPLPWKLKICYGLGHVWNDLCASLWFTYLLLFLKFSLGFDENSAGVLMLIGQVADAIATPLAGLQVDKKYSTFDCWKYGHRKTWHLIGTAAVLVSFPFIFENCLMPECFEYVEDSSKSPLLTGTATMSPASLTSLPTTTFALQTFDESLTNNNNNDNNPFNHTSETMSTPWNFSLLYPAGAAPTATSAMTAAGQGLVFEAPATNATPQQNATSRRAPTRTLRVTAGKTFYYAVFITVFQFGWAAVQIAHLSLIPCLTHCQHQRTELNAIRYGFTVLSNIAVYSIAWIVLGMADENNGRISSSDTSNFRNISLISTGIGAVFTVLFHIGVKEDPLPVKSAATASLPPSSSAAELTSTASSDENGGRVVRRIKFYEWLKTREFYEVAMIYQTTRLFFNLSQVYITLYLQETLSLGHQSVAVIPLIMFIAGFAATFFMKKLNKQVGRKVAFGIGFLPGLVGSIWIWAGDTRTSYKEIEVYFVAVLLGASGSVLLVTSLSITADLIGPNSANGGFIYGAMSFADKMTNGFAIMIIQYFNPCQNVADCPTNPYPGMVLVIGCSSSAIIGMIFVLFMKDHDHEAGVFNMPHSASTASDLGNANATATPAPTGHTNPAFRLNEKGADADEQIAVSNGGNNATLAIIASGEDGQCPAQQGPGTPPSISIANN